MQRDEQFLVAAGVRSSPRRPDDIRVLGPQPALDVGEDAFGRRLARDQPAPCDVADDVERRLRHGTS
jgi:hypothetical protein